MHNSLAGAKSRLFYTALSASGLSTMSTLRDTPQDGQDHCSNMNFPSKISISGPALVGGNRVDEQASIQSSPASHNICPQLEQLIHDVSPSVHTCKYSCSGFRVVGSPRGEDSNGFPLLGLDLAPPSPFNNDRRRSVARTSICPFIPITTP